MQAMHNLTSLLSQHSTVQASHISVSEWQTTESDVINRPTHDQKIRLVVLATALTTWWWYTWTTRDVWCLHLYNGGTSFTANSVTCQIW